MHRVGKSNYTLSSKVKKFFCFVFLNLETVLPNDPLTIIKEFQEIAFVFIIGSSRLEEPTTIS